MHTETFSFFFFFQTCAQLMKIVENWQSGFWHTFEKFWQISGGLSSAGSYVPLMMSHRKPSRTARAYFSHLCKTSVLNAPSLLMRPTWAAPRMVTALVAQVQIGQEWLASSCLLGGVTHPSWSGNSKIDPISAPISLPLLVASLTTAQITSGSGMT